LFFFPLVGASGLLGRFVGCPLASASVCSELLLFPLVRASLFLESFAWLSFARASVCSESFFLRGCQFALSHLLGCPLVRASG
jgi:hypothetical protein